MYVYCKTRNKICILPASNGVSAGGGCDTEDVTDIALAFTKDVLFLIVSSFGFASFCFKWY